MMSWHCRTRLWDPPPQEAEQAVHSDQGVRVGQGEGLQASVTEAGSSPHWPAADLGSTHSRTFVRVPPPQV